MSWPEIRENVRQYLVRLVRLTTLAGSSADGRSEQAVGYERGPGDPAYGFGMRRMQHYGYASWVPRAAEIIALAINGGKNNRAYVASDLPGAAPVLAAEGDVVVYNSRATGGTTTIYFDHAGNITITPAPGAKIRLGGADAADPVVTKSTLDAVVNIFNEHVHGVSHATAGPYSCSGSTDAPSSGMVHAPDRAATTK